MATSASRCCSTYHSGPSGEAGASNSFGSAARSAASTAASTCLRRSADMATLLSSKQLGPPVLARHGVAAVVMAALSHRLLRCGHEEARRRTVPNVHDQVQPI